MTAATGIKRVGIAVASLLGAALALLLVLSVVIPADTVRDAVKAQIKEVTGLDPTLRGDVSVSLFPTGSVRFNDVSLGDSTGAPALSAQQLVVRLRFFSFMFGRIEIADVTLIRPRIAVTFDHEGRSNWSPLIDRLTRALKPGGQRTMRTLSFSEIRIADGTVFLHDERRKISETLADVEMSLAWPSISKSFGATGRFLWRNEPVDTSIALGDLLAAITGERSGLKVRLTGAPLKLAFDGHISQRPTLKMEGTLATDGKSLRDLMRWANMLPLPGGGGGRFALKAQTTLTGGNFALSNANLELDGNVTEGVLALSTDPRMTLKGTLAGESLDLTPYIANAEVLRASERDWSRAALSVDGLSDFDLDLRLSAARVTVATARLGRTGVAANLRDGRLALTIGEAQAFGGVLKGSIGLARSDAGSFFTNFRTPGRSVSLRNSSSVPPPPRAIPALIRN